jgi:hypothetical protein
LRQAGYRIRTQIVQQDGHEHALYHYEGRVDGTHSK